MIITRKLFYFANIFLRHRHFRKLRFVKMKNCSEKNTYINHGVGIRFSSIPCFSYFFSSFAADQLKF